MYLTIEYLEMPNNIIENQRHLGKQKLLALSLGGNLSGVFTFFLDFSDG